MTFHLVRDAAAQEAGVGEMQPGRFYQLKAGAEQTVFAEARSKADPKVVENVFVEQRDADGISVLSAARATEVVDHEQGFRFLRLSDGYRYELGHSADHLEITGYEELVIRTPLEGSAAETTQDHSLSAVELARSSNPEDAAELQWRIASPVSSFLLVLLAIPLSRITRGQYTKLFVASALPGLQPLGMVKK